MSKKGNCLLTLCSEILVVDREYTKIKQLEVFDDCPAFDERRRGDQ